MTTLYWQIAPELDQLRRQAERMLEDQGQVSMEPKPWKPAAELRDLGDRYQLQLQLPGVNAESLDIQATQDSVTVIGERPESQAQLIHSEFRTGAFKRAVRLPEAVQHQAVTADYAHGLLTLSLPKLTSAPDYQVRVEINGMAAAASPAVEAPQTKTSTEAAPTDSPQAEAMEAEQAEDLWAEPV